eukprot:5098476-Prymnesium_polylepis.1
MQREHRLAALDALGEAGEEKPVAEPQERLAQAALADPLCQLLLGRVEHANLVEQPATASLAVHVALAVRAPRRHPRRVEHADDRVEQQQQRQGHGKSNDDQEAEYLIDELGHKLDAVAGKRDQADRDGSDSNQEGANRNGQRPCARALSELLRKHVDGNISLDLTHGVEPAGGFGRRRLCLRLGGCGRRSDERGQKPFRGSLSSQDGVAPLAGGRLRFGPQVIDPVCSHEIKRARAPATLDRCDVAKADVSFWRRSALALAVIERIFRKREVATLPALEQGRRFLVQ